MGRFCTLYYMQAERCSNPCVIRVFYFQKCFVELNQSLLKIKMHIAIAEIELVAPYCQSRFHNTPKLNKESADAYEKRTWMERLHYDENGQILIPGGAFANCVKEAAKYLSIKTTGQATWTKHFEAGVQVLMDIPTGIHKKDAMPVEMFVPSNGVRGAGKRVMKTYPVMPAGTVKVTVEFNITDDAITAPIFAEHLQQAGLLIGVGSFRVRNSGTYGRFNVNQLTWVAPSTTAKLPPINYSTLAA